MKWLVWGLLLLNVAVFGVFKLTEGHTTSSEPLTGHEPIAPEKIKMLTPDELNALPKKAASPADQPQLAPISTTAPAAVACYEWGGFPVSEVMRAKAALDTLGLQAQPRQLVPHEGTRFWVYVPPRHTQEEAQAKVDELKALGVTDTFIVKEVPWRYAISLGMFKDEALANKFLESLRQRGVKSAVKGLKGHDGEMTSYVLSHVTLSQDDLASKLQPGFPGIELKQVSCQ